MLVACCWQALFAQKVRTSLVCEDMPLQLEAGGVPTCEVS